MTYRKRQQCVHNPYRVESANMNVPRQIWCVKTSFDLECGEVKKNICERSGHHEMDERRMSVFVCTLSNSLALIGEVPPATPARCRRIEHAIPATPRVDMAFRLKAPMCCVTSASRRTSADGTCRRESLLKYWKWSRICQQGHTLEQGSPR